MMDDPLQDPLFHPWRDPLRALPQRQASGVERFLFKELNPTADRSAILLNKDAPPRTAAVLVPILPRGTDGGGPSVLFTVRAKTMPSHAGEISFPGGGAQPSDGTLVNTALRETSEEVGVPAQAVEVVGTFGVHHGGRGFAVTPVVGIIDPGAKIVPCDREVAEVFDVPLAHLADPANHIVETRTLAGFSYQMFAVPYDDGRTVRHIWGLTAGILDTFAKAYNDLPLDR